jgi:hypothetical protein
VVLAVARGEPAPEPAPREALVEVMTAAGLVRRAGTNLNATGQRGVDLLPVAEFCARVTRSAGRGGGAIAPRHRLRERGVFR